jgi:hypothetical protein
MWSIACVKLPVSWSIPACLAFGGAQGPADGAGNHLRVASGPSRCALRSSRASEGAPRPRSSTTLGLQGFVEARVLKQKAAESRQFLASSLYRYARLQVTA